METDWHTCTVSECDENGGLSQVALPGRRFNDGPAVVPIKKRKIQMVEVVRSPSSIPRSPSPVNESAPARLPSSRSLFAPLKSPSFRSPSLTPLSPRLVSLGQKLGDGDGDSTVGNSIWSSYMVPTLEKEEKGVIVCSVSPISIPFSLLQTDDSYKGEDEQNVMTVTKGCLEDLDMVGESSEDFTRQVNGHNASDAVDCVATLDGPQGMLTGLDLGFSQDIRPCWDLNMKMGAWDRPREQLAEDKVQVSKVNNEALDILNSVEDKDEVSKVSREALGSVDSDESRHGKRMGTSVVDLVKLQVDEEYETEELVDYGHSDYGNVKDNGVQINERMTMTLQAESDWKTEAAAGNLERGAAANKFEPGKASFWKGQPASDDGKAYEESRMQGELRHDTQDKHMLESKLEGESSSSKRKATSSNELPEELEAEEHVDYGDSDWRDADNMGLEVEERTSRELQLDSNGAAEEESGDFEAGNVASWEGDGFSDVSETPEISGEQVDDFNGSVCDTQQLEPRFPKRAKSEKTKSSGWDQLPEGFDSAEQALKGAKDYFSGCNHGRHWAASGGRSSINGSQGALPGSQCGSRRGAFREVPFAKADGSFRDRAPFNGRWLSDGLDTNPKFHNISRGRNSGSGPLAGIHGGGRAGGWVDTRGVSVGHWVPGRRRLTTGFGSQVPANAAAVAAAKVKSSGFFVTNDGTITKSGRGVASLAHHSGHAPFNNAAMGPPLDIEVGVNFTNRIGRVGKIHLGPVIGPVHERRGLTGRKDRFQMPPFGKAMESKRRQSTCKSRHPLDHRNLNGHPSASFRSEARVGRSRTPISHGLLGRPSASWSTPPSTKWSRDPDKDDSFWDKELKQPLPCSHIPSRRAPRCVHGSYSKNKWDGHVLAGTKYTLPACKSRDGSPEVCHSKQDEHKEIRIAGLWSREGDHTKSSTRGAGNDGDNRAVHRGNKAMNRVDAGRDGDRRDFY